MSSAEREWSAYQRAIFDDVERGEGHTVVQARAGCGKTTTIVKSFDFLPARASTLMAAFNKGIAAELAARAPERVTVKTLHAFGFGAIRRAFSGVRVDDRKTENILREWVQDAELRVELGKTVRLAKGALASRPEQIGHIIDEYGIDVGGRRDGAVRTVIAALEESMRQADLVDFEDMVWLPHALGLRLPTFDRIFIDETQDLTRAQTELAIKACRRGGRICAVGDDRQAIYGFRGASAGAMARVTTALGAATLPLSTTYRCPKSIVRLANNYVPDFYAAPEAPEGEVLQADVADLQDVDVGDFVLSRTNAPLIGHCLAFLRQGTPARILGRDVGALLKSRIRKARARTVPELVGRIDAWAGAEAAAMLARHPDADTSRAWDVAACIRALAEDAKTVDDITIAIDELFADNLGEGDVITLATTHKAKGLERDRVWVLRDTYLKREKREEENLYYVAITRAKKTLMVVRGARAAS